MVQRVTPQAAPARRPPTGKAAALAVAAMLMSLLGAGADPAAVTEDPASGDGAAQAAQTPGYFEPNLGQFPEHVRFVVRGAGTEAFLTDEGATFVLREAPEALDPLPGPLADAWLDEVMEAPHVPQSLFAVQLRFEDATPGPMEGTERRHGISSHFIGNEPDKWVTGVPNYGRVVQRGVWPGIDIEWHIAPQGLKFDAVVHPGADPSMVRFTLPGADALRLDEAGDLAIMTPLGGLVKEAPFTYQETAKGVQEIPSRYVLEGGAVGFDVGTHDPLRSLVIDPLVYSTYLDGSGGRTEGWDIAVDDEGHAYVTGHTGSSDFPTSPGAYQSNNKGRNLFVSKLTPAGNELVFSTYLGGGLEGPGVDSGYGIAIDLHGNVHLTGMTDSQDFPTKTTFQAEHPGGGSFTAFYTKLNATGRSLDNSTYLGGTDGTELGKGVAVDSQGNAYVVGFTNSRQFPTTLGAAYPSSSLSTTAAFVTKFTREDDRPAYSTYLASDAISHRTFGLGIAVDAQGSAYVTGATDGTNFPVTTFQTSKAGTGDKVFDAFVTKFTPEGNGLVYSTYLGGSDNDIGQGIAVDGDGHAHVTGLAQSGDFPVESAFLANNPGGVSAFLTKMNPVGNGLAYSTYLGGTGTEGNGVTISATFTGQRNTGGVTVDAAGNTYVTVYTASSDLAQHGLIVNPYQAELPGSQAAFVARFPPSGSAPVWGTYLGGTGMDTPNGIAADPSGSAYVIGHTRSSDFPVEKALQPAPGGSFPAAFVSKLYGIVADFTWASVCPAMVFQDLSVSMTDTPLVRSEWDFGEGSPAESLDPRSLESRHVYQEPGSHSVRLSVFDENGIGGSVTHAVEVPYCPPTNHPPVLKKLPCIGSTPGQQLSFRLPVHDPNGPPDPASYYALRFFAEDLPPGATLDADGRFTWEVGPPDTYVFVVHVEDEGLLEHGVPSLGDSGEYCINVQPHKPAPDRDDDSGDGVQNWHDACPHMKSPDQGDTSGGGLDDPCDPAAPPEPEEAPEEEGPPPGGCPNQPAGPREVTARWTDGAVQITWQSDSWCPPDHFLVWNGTGHHLVDFVPAEAGVHYVVLNLEPWPEPHQYFVQAMGADEGLFFDPTRAVASNLIDPAGCILEGPRSEACLPLEIDEEPPAAVEPAGPEAAAPADGLPLGLIATAVGLAVAGLMALLWRLRHAPWVVHLFTRVGRDDVLEHPVRRKIMELVTTEPGIHYMEVLRRTGKSHGTAQHHLQVLLAANMVLERKSGQYICYWPSDGAAAGGDGAKGAPAEGLLRSAVARRLLRLLLDEPGLSVAELADRLGANAATVRYHLRRLEKEGLARLERNWPRARVYPGKRATEALARPAAE